MEGKTALAELEHQGLETITGCCGSLEDQGWVIDSKFASVLVSSNTPFWLGEGAAAGQVTAGVV